MDNNGKVTKSKIIKEFKDCRDIFNDNKEITSNKSEVTKKYYGAREYKYFPIFFWNFYLSYKCTRQCPQCYTHSSPFSELEMSDEKFERLLNFIIDVYDKSNIAIHQLTFLGGDPLLCTDRIKRINDVVSEKTKGMVSVFITNGDLIDSVNWDDLTKVSVWGLNISDLSLNEINRRINIIREHHRSGSYTLFGTLDNENLHEDGRMENITAYGLENNCRFRYCINVFKGNDEEYKSKVLKKLHSIVDVCEKYHAKGYNVPTSYILDRTIPNDWENIESKHKYFTPYACGRNVISVKADGNISPCIRNHDLSVASIYDSAEDALKKIKVPEFEYAYANKFIDKECMICDVRFVCQGGCPVTRYNAYGKVEGKFPLCRMYKEIIPRLMAITKPVRWKD